MEDHVRVLTDELNRHWEEPDGCIWKVRYLSVIDDLALEDLKRLLCDLGDAIGDRDSIEMKVVKAVWLLPTTLQWNSEAGGTEEFRKKCKKAADDIADIILSRVFGS